MKKYLRSFRVAVIYPLNFNESETQQTLEDLDKRVNQRLKVRGITAEDVVSVTLRHVQQYETYTVWYRSEK